MTGYKKTFIGLLLVFGTNWLYAQGCSDAGFCTMGAMKPDQAYSKKVDFKLRTFEFNYYRGTSLASPVITVLTADMNIGITDYFSVQVKAPYQMVSGRLGDTQGVGDFSISASRAFPLKNGASMGLTLGGKIPTGKSNIESDHEFGTGHLPMYYQISLGTYDLVFGLSYINEKWLFATGIQHPLVHQNENDFRWGKWAAHPDQEYILDYDLANNLKRGTDVMLRAERNFRFINFNIGIGGLAIYRIKEDWRYNFNTDIEEGIDQTLGLAFNMLANVGYQINVNSGVKVIYGLKFVDREFNPDGLSRHDVTSLSYVYRF
ncbi:MAG: hypothetical protein JXR10_13770 [Cyclobacteriaceae bacterium]